MAARKSGRANQRLTAWVLDTMGRECMVRLPGCTGRATTRDHITPVAQGGTDAPSNLRPACRPCNSKRGNRTAGQRVHVITGPPAAGKSTYVREHAGSQDVIIDLDRIALSISAEGMDHHGYPEHIKHVAIGMRAAAIQRATRLRERVHVWLIHSMPSPDQVTEYRGHGWEVVEVDPGRAEVLARAATQRPEYVYPVIDRWYGRKAAEAAASDPAAGALAPPSRSW